jgi:NTE family protein
VRRGLALGCGGTLGMSWTVATLAELERAWGWDAREAEVIIGTSAGAELAVMLGGGTTIAEIYRAQLADPQAPSWLAEHLRAGPGRMPPAPKLAVLRPASLSLAGAAVRRKAPGLAGVCGLLPCGTYDPSWLVRLAATTGNHDGWVDHPAVWLVAADYDTGERVAFGAPGAPAATLAQAVCASWGLPSWLPAVEVDGRRYVDGGILSPASADLAIGLDLDELVVLAPMASSDPGRPVGLLAAGERVVRRRMTKILDNEIAAVEAAGTRVIRLEPNGRDLAAMGPNFMNPKNRGATLVSATASAQERFATQLVAR